MDAIEDPELECPRVPLAVDFNHVALNPSHSVVIPNLTRETIWSGGNYYREPANVKQM